MFDGVPDQLHQFIASSRTSLPIPLNFPIHGNNTTNNNTFPSFDPYPPPASSNLQSHLLLRPLLLHHHPSQTPTHRDIDERLEDTTNSRNSLMISPTTDHLVLERERLTSKPIDPWSNDEVLALLRIRSSLENWFPDFTWEHVSRKLAELGFKRSAEKCKDKFEEESRYFNMNTNINYNNNNNNNKHNYRFLSELEELCHGDDESTVNEHIEDENSNEKMVVEKPNEQVLEEQDQEDKIAQSLVEEVDCVGQNKEEEVVVVVAKKSKGEKRKRKFEMMKCFCESFVKNLMAQQEELYNKILEDMVKRDEENFAREEAWKKQEMDRFNKEIEIRANEQAIAGDRQATINEFLKKFTSSSPDFKPPFFVELVKVPNSTTTTTTILAQQNPNPTCELEITQNKLEKRHTSSSTMVVSHQNPSSCPNQNNPNGLISLTETLPPQNPSSSTLVPNISNVTTSSTLALARAQNDSSMPTSNSTHKTPQSPNSLNTQISNPSMPTSNSTHKTHQNPNNFGSNDEDKDIGKRWPRDEVLALINIRSNFYNTNEDKEGSANNNNNNNKGPLWEKISQGMLDLGYKRSAKRCKEKWENINKYFRKTKDNVNKKRSFDSRTCPYFHQLSNLYKQGTPSNWSENHSPSPENHPNLPEMRPGGVPSLGVSNKANKHADQGEKNMIQTPSFDFEF